MGEGELLFSFCYESTLFQCGVGHGEQMLGHHPFFLRLLPKTHRESQCKTKASPTRQRVIKSLLGILKWDLKGQVEFDLGHWRQPRELQEETTALCQPLSLI